MRIRAPPHKSGIATKEENSKGNWPGSGKARLGTTVSASASAGDGERGAAGRPPRPARRRGRRRRGRRRRPGWRERRRRPRRRRGRPAGLQAAQRGEPEGDAEREGELAVGEQRHHARGEPEGRPARLRPPAVADQAVEQVGGGDDGEPAHHLRAEQRRQRREEDAVGEGVVAAVPAAVPDRQAGPLEQLARKTCAARSPTGGLQRSISAASAELRATAGAIWPESLWTGRLAGRVKHTGGACDEFKRACRDPVLRRGFLPYEEARGRNDARRRAASAARSRASCRRSSTRRSTPAAVARPQPAPPMAAEWYEAQGIEVRDTDGGGRVTYRRPRAAGRVPHRLPRPRSRWMTAAS